MNPTAAPRTRAAYGDISLYAPDRTPAPVDLSDNTNLWGAPPVVLRAIHEAAAASASVTRYPPLYAAALKAALAAYAGVAHDEVVTGCGSDDVLDSAIRAFAEPGERVAFADPSFAMVPLFARMNGLAGVPVPLTATLEPDPDALLATRASIIYLCSPNNPTGAAAPDGIIERVVTRAPGLVILDEAYAEFMGGGWAGRAPAYGNLLVTRTLSKAFGLAGLRVGYATGARALVAEVEKSRGPYKVSALAERAALAALGDGRDWVRARIGDACRVRARLSRSLAAMGFAPIPSAANFVLVPVSSAAETAAALRGAGVAVRPFERLRGIGDALRITVGPWPMMRSLLAALEPFRPCA